MSANNISNYSLAFIFVLAALSLLLRVLMLGYDLPYHSLDENDIVEPSLAFLAGDWDPRWYKYGPLFSYILAIIYGGLQWVLITFFDWTSDRFYYSAFYDAAFFYHIGRTLHFTIIASIVALATKFCWRYYDRQTGYVLLIFGIAPLIESITAYTMRIDTLQGLMALACLYFAVKFDGNDRYYKNYLLAGLFAGLVFATKPLTGLLLLPAIAVAHLLSGSWSRRLSLTQVARQFLIENKGLYVFFLALVVAHYLVHPYSLINFTAFWQEQYQVIFTKSDQGGSTPGYSFGWLFEYWGIPLALLALLSPILLFWQRDRVTCILLSYILTFILAFLIFDTRIYWYNSIIPVVMVIMARFLVVGLDLLRKKYKPDLHNTREMVLLIALLLILSPLVSMRTIVSNGFEMDRADQAAQIWIEENIEPGSRVLTVGWYSATLPRIRSVNVKSDAKWAEHFMYQRNRNQAWVDKFLLAHKQLLESEKPTYEILNLRKHYGNNYKGERIGDFTVDELFETKLPFLAKLNKVQYIVTASMNKFSGEWEEGNNVELLMKYGAGNGYRGAEVKIFVVK